jgi:hypothetical protein
MIDFNNDPELDTVQNFECASAMSEFHCGIFQVFGSWRFEFVSFAYVAPRPHHTHKHTDAHTHTHNAAKKPPSIITC